MEGLRRAQPLLHVGRLHIRAHGAQVAGFHHTERVRRREEHQPNPRARASQQVEVHRVHESREGTARPRMT